MSATTRKYNPGFLTDDELVASFCVRSTEFELLVDVLRECTGSANQHQLVIGPRGSGKTSLLLRVAAEVRRDAELASRCFPIVFAEETYEVATAGEFWLECLSHLAGQAPRGEDAPDLRRTVDELRATRDDQILAHRCLGALLDFADQQDKRLLLIAENLNTLFREMSDRDAGWKLRKVLQTEPRIILFASATSRFEEIDNPDRALYDLFQVRRLRPLDTNQCTVLWETVAGRQPARPTVRSLEILTGGNPRLIAIVARFGAGLSFRELMADLLDLVDDHTEYFRSHLESLPAQERRVYLALAALWKPATTREIADQARLDTSTCSAQLARLAERGVVQVTGGSARRKQYYLTERLYNIYYLLRRRRGPEPLVEALIHFMESYYSPVDLRNIGVRMAHDVQTAPEDTQSLCETLFARLMELPALTEYRREILESVPADRAEAIEARAERTTAAKLLDELSALVADDRHEEIQIKCDQFVRRFVGNTIPPFEELVASVFNAKVLALHLLGRADDAIAVCNEVVDRFGASEAPNVQDCVATALSMKGDLLARSDRRDEAMAAYDELIQRSEARGAPAFAEGVVQALFQKGSVLVELKRFEDALVILDNAIERFGSSEVPAILKIVALSLIRKVVLLNSLDRVDAALEAADELVRRFGEQDVGIDSDLVALSLVTKGVGLARLERYDDALTTLDEVGHRYGAHPTGDLVQALAMAFGDKGVLLDLLGRPNEAVAAFDEALHWLGKTDTAWARATFETTLLEKADLEVRYGRYDAAVATVDLLLPKCAESSENRWKAHLARAKAYVAMDGPAACVPDIEAILSILPRVEVLSRECLEALMRLSIDVGPKQMLELIQASPSASLLVPLATALAKDLGLQPRVAQEIEEVAQDIRAELSELRAERAAGGE